MDKYKKQILKNQKSIMEALQYILINSILPKGIDISSIYESLSNDFFDTFFLLQDEEN